MTLEDFASISVTRVDRGYFAILSRASDDPGLVLECRQAIGTTVAEALALALVAVPYGSGLRSGTAKSNGDEPGASTFATGSSEELGF